MKILLTGGTGQVGVEFLRRAEGLNVWAPARASFDLAQPASLAAALDAETPDLIVNAAAYTAVDRAEDEPSVARAVNATAVEALAVWASRRDVPLVHLSTDYVFDGRTGRRMREDDPPAPAGIYARTKLEGETAARSVPRHIVLRTSWVFSSHGTNFVRTMLRLAAERDRLRVVDDQHGGPTWAGDVASALIAIVVRIASGDSPPWGIYHFTGQPHTTWCGFAREIVLQAHARGLLSRAVPVDAITTAEFPTRAPRPADSRLDTTRVQQALGLPAPDWHAGLARALDEIAATHREP